MASAGNTRQPSGAGHRGGERGGDVLKGPHLVHMEVQEAGLGLDQGLLQDPLLVPEGPLLAGMGIQGAEGHFQVGLPGELDEAVRGEREGLRHRVRGEPLHDGAQALVDGVEHDVEPGAHEGHPGEGAAGELLEELGVPRDVIAGLMGGGLGEGQGHQRVRLARQRHVGGHPHGLDRGAPGTYARLQVVDDGKGMDEAELVRADVRRGVEPEHRRGAPARGRSERFHLKAPGLSGEPTGHRLGGLAPAP